MKKTKYTEQDMKSFASYYASSIEKGKSMDVVHRLNEWKNEYKN